MFVIVPIKSCVFFRISSLRDRGSCINYVIAANDLGDDDCLTANSKVQIWYIWSRKDILLLSFFPCGMSQCWLQYIRVLSGPQSVITLFMYDPIKPPDLNDVVFTPKLLLSGHRRMNTAISLPCLLNRPLTAVICKYKLNKSNEAFGCGSSYTKGTPEFKDSKIGLSNLKQSTSRHGGFQGKIHKDVGGKLWGVFEG